MVFWHPAGIGPFYLSLAKPFRAKPLTFCFSVPLVIGSSGCSPNQHMEKASQFRNLALIGSPADNPLLTREVYFLEGGR